MSEQQTAKTEKTEKPEKVEKKRVLLVSGKRKTAIARAIVKNGSGKTFINGIPLQTFTPEIARVKISEPIILSGERWKTLDFNVKVTGGGFIGQAEAARMAIAKGLVKYSNDKTLKAKFLEYDRNLLVYDPRRNESHHSSGRGASKRGSRRHKQRSKR